MSAGDVVGRARVVIDPDATQFGPQLQQDMRQVGTSVASSLQQSFAAVGGTIDRVGQRITGLGQTASRVGGSLTASLTLPLVGFGTAAFRAFSTFEENLSRITGLVGIAADETAELGRQARGIAVQFGTSASEVSDALFTVTSAGFRGADAIDVLRAATQAAASGLGETRSIAEALTGAVNAYGTEVLTASRATEIITATARAGNFATDQLAGSLGRVTPFAKEAGVAFDDVGGAIALLTRVNNDAAESVTQIAALLRAFAAPTQQTIDALDELGLSTTDVRTAMGEQGLVGVLQDLDRRLGGNRDLLRAIIPDSQGFSAALQILNADAETLEGTFGQVADSAGILDEAFAATEQSATFRFRRAITQLQDSLLTFGEDIIGEVVAGIHLVAFAVEELTERWVALDPEVRQSIIRFGAFAAALGPILLVGGRVVSAIGGIISTFGRLITTIGLVATPFGAVVAVIGTLAAAFAAMVASSPELQSALAELAGPLGELAAAFGQLATQALVPVGEAIGRFIVAITPTVVATVEGLAAGLALLADAMSGLAAGDFDSVAATLESIDTRLRPVGETLDRLFATLSEAGASIGQATDAIGNLADALFDLFGAAEGPSVDRLDVAAGILKFIVDVFTAVPQSAAQRVRDIADGIRLVADAATGLTGVAAANVERINAALLDLAGLAGRVRAAADRFGRAFGIVAGSVNTLAGPLRTVIGLIDRLIRLIGQIPDRIRLPSLPSLPSIPSLPFIPNLNIFGADGGIFDRPTAKIIGEAGPEVLLPLSRPARTAQLMQAAGLTTNRNLTLTVNATGDTGRRSARRIVSEVSDYLWLSTGEVLA